MDSDTDIQELKNRIQEFCEKRDWGQYHNGKELSIGIATEASELLEHFRFKSEEEVEAVFDDPEKSQVEDEMADVFYFLLRMAQVYNIDLSEALDNKMEENREKYPVEKSKGSNKKYDKLE